MGRWRLLLSLSLLLAAAGNSAAGTLRSIPGSMRLRDMAADDGTPRAYIVQLAARPAVREPPPGHGTRRRASAARGESARRTAEALTAQHDGILQAIGAGDAKLYSYRYALNGFAARLTPAQARKLRARRDVRSVREDRFQHLQTNASPAFLGLSSKPGGLWSDRGLRGDGVIIGVIDSGISPGHPSFSDKRAARRPRLCRTPWADSTLLGRWLCQRFKNRADELVYTRPADWRGQCQAGNGFTTTDCNNKLIGARYYLDGFLQQYALDANEFVSPKDADGHGTHIASIAAGNRVRASIGGASLADVSGMAPRAWVAVYKACWLEPGTDRGSCSTADLAAAIDDAVADGVDIINYSIGTADDILDLDDIALLNASDAGVLAVAAAGNEGPLPGSMLSPAGAPWVVAVGASSRRGDRFREALRVNSPAAVKGDYAAVEAAITPTLRTVGPLTGHLALADDGLLGAFDDGTGTIVLGTAIDACETIRNTGEVSGKIAFVERQSNRCTFDVKLANIGRAGATAAVVFNRDGAPLIMSGTRGSVSIPAVMIGKADGELILARLQGGDTVDVTLDKRLLITEPGQGNVMWPFSARGPNPWGEDILKPDVTAPGVDILGAQTPDVANGVRGERFQYLSGTSMAVPHVAGVAALLKQAHPDWSPAAIKSALVTTARQDLVKEDGTTPANPFDFGGGHIVPNAAVDPGLVYDAGAADYDAFLCGRGVARDPVDCDALAADGYPADATDLNLPAIAVSDLVSERVIRRHVTNTGEAAQYSVQVDAPSTIDVEVTPSVLSLGAGETGEYQVRLSTVETTFDAWQFGSLTWLAGAQTVRSPLAVQAVKLEAPAIVTGSGTSGTQSFNVRFGYTGSYTATLLGIAASGESQPAYIQVQLQGATVQDDPFDSYTFVQPGAGTPPVSVRRIPIVVAPGQRLLRVALFNDATDGADDLDLYLYHCPGFGRCTQDSEPSGNDDSNEVITVIDPPAGEYYVDVHGFNTDGPSATFTLFVWTLGTDLGNATLNVPASATAGNTGGIDLRWANLQPGRNLGLISHGDGTATLALTVIELGP